MCRTQILVIAVLSLVFAPLAAYGQSATPVTGIPNNKTTINRSVSIASGTVFQAILSKGSYKSITIQNNNTNTDNCWITFGTTTGGTLITAGNATVGESIILAPGQGYSRFFPSILFDEVEATCTNTNDTLYVDTQ